MPWHGTCAVEHVQSGPFSIWLFDMLLSLILNTFCTILLNSYKNNGSSNSKIITVLAMHPIRPFDLCRNIVGGKCIILKKQFHKKKMNSIANSVRIVSICNWFHITIDFNRFGVTNLANIYVHVPINFGYFGFVSKRNWISFCFSKGCWSIAWNVTIFLALNWPLNRSNAWQVRCERKRNVWRLIKGVINCTFSQSNYYISIWMSKWFPVFFRLQFNMKMVWIARLPPIIIYKAHKCYWMASKKTET